jgi:hypothetical protein
LLFLAALVATGGRQSRIGLREWGGGWEVMINQTREVMREEKFHSRCLRGALPPVDLRAVCLVRAIVEGEDNGDGEVERWRERYGVVCGG